MARIIRNAKRMGKDLGQLVGSLTLLAPLNPADLPQHQPNPTYPLYVSEAARTQKKPVLNIVMDTPSIEKTLTPAQATSEFELSGTITDVLTGEPLSGLMVEYTPPGQETPELQMTGMDGKYTFITTSVDGVDYTDNNTRARIALGVQNVTRNGNGVNFNVLNGVGRNFTVKVSSITGSEVYNGAASGIGNVSVPWDGRNKYGNQVSSGVYLYTIKNDQGNWVSGRIIMLTGRYANAHKAANVAYKPRRLPPTHAADQQSFPKYAMETGRLRITHPDYYTYDNDNLDPMQWNENKNVQMIRRAEDAENPGLDLLDHLKWYTATDGSALSSETHRYIVEKGPILVYLQRDNSVVSTTYKDLVWDGMVAWEDSINAYLSDKHKITMFEEVDYDPTPENRTNMGRANNSAGGWRIDYDHHSAGEFPSSSIISVTSEYGLHPVYGKMRLNPSFDDLLTTDLVKDQMKALSEHEAGHGLGFLEHSTYDNHAMNAGNASFNPPLHISSFEGLANAVQYKLSNVTNMKHYSK